MIRLSKYDRQQLINEARFETSRSGGKGGQHANKTETRVTLVLDIHDSNVLSFAQKERIQRNLNSHVKSGVLRISSEKHRSQSMNKNEVIKRFLATLENALKEQEKRVPTKVPKAQKEKRLEEKKRLQHKKALRKKVRDIS